MEEPAVRLQIDTGSFSCALAELRSHLDALGHELEKVDEAHRVELEALGGSPARSPRERTLTCGPYIGAETRRKLLAQGQGSVGASSHSLSMRASPRFSGVSPRFSARKSTGRDELPMRKTITSQMADPLTSYQLWKEGNGHTSDGSPAVKPAAEKSDNNSGNGGQEVQKHNSFSDTVPDEAENEYAMPGDGPSASGEVLTGPSFNELDLEPKRSVNMCEIWAQPAVMHKGTTGMRSSGSLMAEALPPVCAGQSVMRLFDEQEEPWLARFVWSPDAPSRVCWDLTGMCLIVFDLVMLPLRFFDPLKNSFMTFMSFLALAFWTIDIPFSLVTGYHVNGLIEKRIARIARRYVTTWLAFDVLVVGSDWVITVYLENDGGSSFSQLRFGRALRFLRMIRLVRLVKVQGRVKEIVDNIRSEACLILLGIVKFLLYIMIANHIIACGWFFVGKQARDLYDDHNWISANNMESDQVSTIYQYMTCLHWSWTQFTPASMEVVPKNSIERLYTVAVLMFAMVTFSSFVSSITNAMTRLRNLNAEKIHQKSQLRQYMVENDVSLSLCARIWAFLQNVESESAKHRKHSTEVPLLNTLPRSLKLELQDAVFLPILAQHPFYTCFKYFYPTQMHYVYKECLQEKAVGMGQQVFLIGEKSEEMLFLLAGQVTYLSGNFFQVDKLLVQPQSWMCEPSMWINWFHTGNAIASKRSDLLAVKAVPFQNLAQKELGINGPARYAEAFAQAFQEDPDELRDVWVDDLGNVSQRHRAWLEDLASFAFRADPQVFRQRSR